MARPHLVGGLGWDGLAGLQVDWQLLRAAHARTPQDVQATSAHTPPPAWLPAEVADTRKGPRGKHARMHAHACLHAAACMHACMPQPVAQCAAHVRRCAVLPPSPSLLCCCCVRHGRERYASVCMGHYALLPPCTGSSSAPGCQSSSCTSCKLPFPSAGDPAHTQCVRVAAMPRPHAALAYVKSCAAATALLLSGTTCEWQPRSSTQVRQAGLGWRAWDHGHRWQSVNAAARALPG